MTKEKSLSEKGKTTIDLPVAGLITFGFKIFREEDVAYDIDRYVNTCFELQKKGQMIDFYVLKNEIFGDLKWTLKKEKHFGAFG